MNGGLQSAYNDSSQVPAGATVDGQVWYFTVTPSDGEDLGDLVSSPSITIYDNTAPYTGTPTLESSSSGNQDGEDLIATASGTNDDDGNDVTNVYSWTVNGDHYANLVMPFDTEIPLYIDHNGTVLDYSGIGNNGLNIGAVWDPDGVVGGAYSFPSGSLISVQETGNSLSGTGSMTQLSVECWIRIDSSGTQYPLIMHSTDGSTTSYRLYVRNYGSYERFRFYVYSGGSSDYVQAYVYENVGEWHHVVAACDGVNATLYVDGNFVGGIPFTGPIDSSSNGLLDIGNGFGGLMDEVRVYPRALSAAQVFQRYIETKDGLGDSSTIVYQETTVGDDFAVTVIPIDSWEDGTPQTSSTLNVLLTTVNLPPRIDWYSPAADTAAVDEGASLDFKQVSSDPNGDPLTYSWTLDTIEQATTGNWTYTPDFTSAGPHTIGVTVYDASLTDYQEWTVNVVDVAYEQNAYLVVRGSDDLIYVRLYNKTTDSWDNWDSLPSGSTIDRPAAAVCLGELHIVVRGSDGSSIWFSSLNLADKSFSGWTQLDGATESTPTLAGNGTHLVLAVRGMDNVVYYRVYDCDAESWGAWTGLPGATSDQPAAAILGDELHLVVRGYGTTDAEKQTLWHGAVDLTDNSFLGWAMVDGATDATPTLAASATRGEVYLSVKGMDSMIYVNTWTSSWQGWSALASGWTNESPAITVTDDVLQFVVKGFDGSSLWHCSVNLDSSVQSSWALLTGSSPSAPTISS